MENGDASKKAPLKDKMSLSPLGDLGFTIKATHMPKRAPKKGSK